MLVQLEYSCFSQLITFRYAGNDIPAGDGFEFLAPTTRRNALRALRAMQLSKPGIVYLTDIFSIMLVKSVFYNACGTWFSLPLKI